MSDKPSKKEGNTFDKIFKENLEDAILPLLKQFAGLELKSVRKLRNKMQTTTEREADFLSEVIDPNGVKFILHVEFQSHDDPEMIYRLQEYHGMIIRKYRLPIRHFVFYFGNRPSKMIKKLPEQLVFRDYTILDFKTIDFQKLLQSETGNEIVMAILADFQNRPPKAILQLITNRLRQVSHSLEELKKYLNQLNVLSRLRNLNEETLKTINKMPITIDFEKDFLYNQGIEKGEVEKTYQTTVNMLKMGFEISAICQALEVEEDYVLKIKKELGL